MSLDDGPSVAGAKGFGNEQPEPGYIAPMRRPPIPITRTLVEVDHPAENSFNKLAHRQLNNALAIAAQQHAKGRLIDIGCGLKPYREIFAPCVTEHVGVDHEDSPHALTSVDVLATAYKIPLDSESFDTALMVELLEHLENPQRGLAEAFRLLRPGGKLIMTSPFFWPLHEEPRDFFRFSPYGLRYLLGEAGFVSVDVQPLSGQWSTLATLTGYALRQSGMRRAPSLLGAFTRFQQWLGARLDDRKFEPWMSWNHVAIAEKP